MKPPFWLAAFLLSLPFRLVLVARPGLGRDEAAYVYWSSHFEPAYAPALQAVLRWLDWVGLDSPWALRLPSIACGAAVLWLLDLRLRTASVPAPARRCAVLALALSPWQTLVGSVIHPDDLLLVATLGFAFLLERGRLWPAVLLAGLAPWTKPTGLLLLGGGIAACLFERSRPRAHRMGAIAMMLALAAPVVLSFRVPMIEELFEFGRIEDDVPYLRRASIGLGSLLFQAGPLLLIAGARGLVERWPGRGRPLDREAAVSLGVSLLFVGVFGGAAFLHSQWKENWIMPAFLVLWPVRGWNTVRPWMTALVVVAGLCSSGVAAVVAHPEWAAAVESRLPAIDYGQKAGGREARVSAAASWEDRLREYGALNDFAREIEVGYETATGAQAPVAIASDDYGLATQLAYVWRNQHPRVVVPTDGIYWRSLEDARQSNPEQDWLVLAVQADAASIWPARGQVQSTFLVQHPYAATSITVGRLAVHPPEPGVGGGLEAPPATDASTGSSEGGSEPTEAIDPLHRPFDVLLQKYVVIDKVRYAAWHANKEDLNALTSYVDALEAARPSTMERDPALAFWINLYNSATLELVLGHYPLASIKEIDSPWKQKVVTVEGKPLSLDDIENQVIRPTFKDARIHFALNCASIGCPPMAAHAYSGARLVEQLDANCRAALKDPRWLALEGRKLRLTKIFDWYGDDFKNWAGGVRVFAAKYAPAELATAIQDPKTSIDIGDYDWKLNRAE